jgi:hypothetical protein
MKKFIIWCVITKNILKLSQVSQSYNQISADEKELSEATKGVMKKTMTAE